MTSPESHGTPLLVQPRSHDAPSIGILHAVMDLTLFTSSPCAGAPTLLVEKGPAPNPRRNDRGSTKSEQVQYIHWYHEHQTCNILHGKATLLTLSLILSSEGSATSRYCSRAFMLIPAWDGPGACNVVSSLAPFLVYCAGNEMNTGR